MTSEAGFKIWYNIKKFVGRGVSTTTIFYILFILYTTPVYLIYYDFSSSNDIVNYTTESSEIKIARLLAETNAASYVWQILMPLSMGIFASKELRSSISYKQAILIIVSMVAVVLSELTSVELDLVKTAQPEFPTSIDLDFEKLRSGLQTISQSCLGFVSIILGISAINTKEETP